MTLDFELYPYSCTSKRRRYGQSRRSRTFFYFDMVHERFVYVGVVNNVRKFPLHGNKECLLEDLLNICQDIKWNLHIFSFDISFFPTISSRKLFRSFLYCTIVSNNKTNCQCEVWITILKYNGLELGFAIIYFQGRFRQFFK